MRIALNRPIVNLILVALKVVRHARHVIFQLVEVAILRELFRAILESIHG
jgi:hypothetical protein